MKKSLTLAAILLVGSATVSACSDNTKAYCEDLDGFKADFVGLTQPSGELAEKVFDQYAALAKAAPDEVADDWDTVNSRLQDFRKTLESAGLDIKKLDEVTAESVSEEDSKAIQEAYTKIVDGTSQAAFEGIEKHAKKECNIDLNDSSK